MSHQLETSDPGVPQTDPGTARPERVPSHLAPGSDSPSCESCREAPAAIRTDGFLVCGHCYMEPSPMLARYLTPIDIPEWVMADD